MKYTKIIIFKGSVNMQLQLENKEIPLYMRVYNYYKEMIVGGKISSGSKIPSIRRCAEELQISRTTVETAYMSLAADGYIISKAQSGFYVTEFAFSKGKNKTANLIIKHELSNIKYDFASAGADMESFNFDLWRRYIKSALRQDKRLLSYGEPQGEHELREALSEYIGRKRNVVCNADSIVVGACIQSLLHILCVLLEGKKKISFHNTDFKQGIAVFRDHGWDTSCEDADIIYATPSHVNSWGEVMNVHDRIRLVGSASKKNQIIIEDDYDNEFSYFNRRTPSLQSIASGKNVIYIGTFSRMLIPSIRISYMVLPEDLLNKYDKIRSEYNQTASKTEQIALCQFIRDGHLDSQIRKQTKLYSAKSKNLTETIKKIFGDSVNVFPLENGLHIKMEFSTKMTADELMKKTTDNGVSLNAVKNNHGIMSVILSCTSIKTEDFYDAVNIIKSSIDSDSVRDII